MILRTSINAFRNDLADMGKRIERVGADEEDNGTYDGMGIADAAPDHATRRVR